MGNIVIGQSGGPTAVINSSLAGAIHAAKQMGIPKIYGMHYGILCMVLQLISERKYRNS